MVGLALLGLVLATSFIGRSARRTVLVLLPVALSMAVAAGAMALFDVRLHLFNLLVIPVAFGIGVDGAVYLVGALEDGPPATRWTRAWASGRAVLGSTLTTMTAFGSLAIAAHPGLASLGQLALLTIGCSLFGNLLWLPALYRLFEMRRDRRRAGEQGGGKEGVKQSHV